MLIRYNLNEFKYEIEFKGLERRVEKWIKYIKFYEEISLRVAIGIKSQLVLRINGLGLES